MAYCVCGIASHIDGNHTCCDRWWDEQRCLACEASNAARRGDIWRSHSRVTNEARRDPPRSIHV